ncbi:hypothetical protein CDL15_Pgr024214 [Punica granatum]|uniref:Uncharacterized protein n=1 Tax=Punica granatum TaxID=22663 RepID=A0A218XXV7_PUNGR|nr:hypothetical protein CDL15_Pgr024214 [Punica granatum]
MEIAEWVMMEAIIIMEEKEGQMMDTLVFQSLSSVVLKKMSCLATAAHGKYSISFPHLKKLSIEECPKMRAFSMQEYSVPSEGGEHLSEENAATVASLSFFNQKVELPRLEKIYLQGLGNLQKLWDDERPSGWRHYNLKTVARGLLQLQEIDIYDCTVLEELIAGGEVLEEDETLPPEDQLLFPWLISLKFRILPNLKRLFPINYSMEWSLLKNLFAYECGQLKIFASELRPRSEEDDIDSQQALLSIEQVIPNLEPLGLGSEDVLTIMDSDFPNDIFRSLKILSLASIQDGSTGFPSKFLLDRFPDSTT